MVVLKNRSFVNQMSKCNRHFGVVFVGGIKIICLSHMYETSNQVVYYPFIITICKCRSSQLVEATQGRSEGKKEQCSESIQESSITRTSHIIYDRHHHLIKLVINTFESCSESQLLLLLIQDPLNMVLNLLLIMMVHG